LTKIISGDELFKIVKIKIFNFKNRFFFFVFRFLHFLVSLKASRTTFEVSQIGILRMRGNNDSKWWWEESLTFLLLLHFFISTYISDCKLPKIKKIMLNIKQYHITDPFWCLFSFTRYSFEKFTVIKKKLYLLIKTFCLQLILCLILSINLVFAIKHLLCTA
jgi:hypothetical protein